MHSQGGEVLSDWTLRLTSVTPPPNPPLRRYEANIASQCGEDGVIAHALDLVGDRNRWCVEFGAADGTYASNTFALIDQEDYSAVLIEADGTLFEALQRRHAQSPRVHVLHKLVGFEGPDRLEAILATTPVPHDFDLLSIDIDGNDFHVWEALETYRPKLVVVEYNQTIPNEIDFVQPRDMAVMQGSSLTALTRLAHTKGYRLIHATVVNGIFVDQAYFARFEIPDDDPAALRADLSHVTWLFQTYDGGVHLVGNQRARWHDVALGSWRFQVVPRWLRGFPPAFSPGRRLVWRVWRAAHDPKAALVRRLGRRP
jgi:hypothetical protein